MLMILNQYIQRKAVQKPSSVKNIIPAMVPIQVSSTASLHALQAFSFLLSTERGCAQTDSLGGTSGTLVSLYVSDGRMTMGWC